MMKWWARITGIIILIFLGIVISPLKLVPTILIPLTIAFFVLGYRWPIQGLGFTLFLIPFPDSFLYFHQPSFSWILFANMAWLAGLFLSGNYPKIQKTKLHFFIGVLLLWCLVSTIRTRFPWSPPAINYYFAADGWKGQFEYLFIAHRQDWYHSVRILMGLCCATITFFWIKNQIAIKNTRLFWLKCFGLGSTIPLIIGTWQYFTGWKMVQFWLDQQQWRVNSTFGDPNSFGHYLSLVLPITFMVGWNQQCKKRYLWWTLTLIQLLFIIFTGSKTGIASMIGSLFIGGTLIYNSHKNIDAARIRLVRIFPLLAIVVFIIPFYLGTVAAFHSPSGKIYPGERWFGGEGKINKVLNGRINIWISGTRMILYRPIDGFGLGQYSRFMSSFKEPSRLGWNPEDENAHAWMLQWAAETGLIGLGLWIIVMSLMIRSSIGTINALGTSTDTFLVWGVIISQISLLIGCIANHPLVLYEFMFLYWVLWGFVSTTDTGNLEQL